MKKPFSALGDTWPEFLGNLVLLIIIGPLYIFLMILVVLYGFIRLLLRFPIPKKIPAVVKDDAFTSEEKFDIYKKRFIKEVQKIEINETEMIATLHTALATVRLDANNDFVMIQLEGADKRLDTGYWHTDEEINIDIYFWYAVAALRSGITYKRNIFGRFIGWAYSKEMSIWMGVSTDSDKHFSSYVKYARKIKI
ncbi:MAG: hypothetical protein EOO17_03470 [Chloroflexi bacterium]|nr:MAG: hypothetical protein EOO17_03470 [Chloroflexota bacterium]